MYTPREFFEAKTAEELSEYLFDAFERHSHQFYVDLSEEDHVLKMKENVYAALLEHGKNKAVSHEMWAIVTLVTQFRRQSDPSSPGPAQLGPAVYDNPAFLESFRNVRGYLRSLPQLKRA